MQIIHPCCCGVDVHTKTVVACLIKQGTKQIRTFSTMTDDLLAMSDWLVAQSRAAVFPPTRFWPLTGLLTKAHISV